MAKLAHATNVLPMKKLGSGPELSRTVMLDLVRGQQSNKPLSVVVMGEYVRKQADTFISPVISIFALSIYIFCSGPEAAGIF